MIGRSFVTTAFALLIGASSAAQTESRPESRPVPPNLGLRIELTTETPVVAGQDALRMKASLVNDGSDPVVVVLPGDGSDAGWRTPIVTWSLPEIASGARRCGNIDPLKPDEVVTLDPGKRVALDWIGLPTLRAGKNEVSLELENVPDLSWSGLPLGPHDGGAMAKVRRSPRFKVVSNVVSIELQDPAAKGLVPSRIVDEQRRRNTYSLISLGKAGSRLEKVHELKHKFLCRTEKEAKDLRGVDLLLLGYTFSPIEKQNGSAIESFKLELTKRMKPKADDVDADTDVLLEAAARHHALYLGWRADVVK